MDRQRSVIFPFQKLTWALRHGYIDSQEYGWLTRLMNIRGFAFMGVFIAVCCECKDHDFVFSIYDEGQFFVCVPCLLKRANKKE